MRPLPIRAIRVAPILIACLVALPLALALTVLTAGHALACPVCMPPDKVTISGGGLARPLTITDPTALGDFGIASFFGMDDRASIAPPRTAATGDGTGYEVTRYYHQLDASYWTDGFDHLRYYPPATPGASALAGRGLIYYEGPTAGDTQHFAAALGLASRTGKWFTATPAEDAAMRTALGAPATTGATSRTSVSTSRAPAPATSPFAAATTLPSLGSLFAAAAVLVVLATLAYMLRGNLGRRRHPHPAPPAETT